MGNKRQAEASRNAAAFMKAKGIRRTKALCPICYRYAAVPMDNHFKFGC